MSTLDDLTAAAIEYGQLHAMCESALGRVIHARESDRMDAEEQLREATDRLYSAMHSLHAAAMAYRKAAMVAGWGDVFGGGQA